MSTAASTEKTFFTIPELLTRWHVSRTTLHREVKRKKIKPTRIAGRVRFSSDEVARYERLAAA